jgi:hypothetical protein
LRLKTAVMYEYTSSDTVILKEYGRNIQKMVEYLKTIPDRQERTEKAYLVVEMMKQIHPNFKEFQETPSKFWDDLFIIAQFDLDIDAPYPMPEKDMLGKKPERVAYSTNNIKFRHYGKNIQLLVQAVAHLPEGERKKELEAHLFNLMKSFHQAWQKDNIEDSVLVEQIKDLSDGAIQCNLDELYGNPIVSSSQETKNLKATNTSSSNHNKKNKKNAFNGNKKNKNWNNKNKGKY